MHIFQSMSVLKYVNNNKCMIVWNIYMRNLVHQLKLLK